MCKQPAPGLVSKVDPHDPIGRLTRMTLGKFFVAGLVALLGGTIEPARCAPAWPAIALGEFRQTDLASVLQEGGQSANMYIRPGAIWEISAKYPFTP